VVAIAGSGPALHFTRAGYAGVTVDGPHGGIRNVTGGDEQFLMFNIGNPQAMRDNVRQSALELALMADVIAALDIDTSACPGADPSAQLDATQLALMGHSMGATIAPLTLAIEPRFRAAILSGAGGSWIENVVHKLSPLPVRPLAEVLLFYSKYERKLHEHDPVLTLLQWAGEPADPPPYARLVSERSDPPHVLMLQGIVDTYILPPIANATSLSFGLDLAGTALDAGDPELAAFTPLEDVLAFGAGAKVALPASGDAITAVVVQHAEDAIEDGHEVMYQTEAPKHQYRCFLDTLKSGAPIVLDAAPEDAPCTR
jgi:pimeloyl-ACP methyl ester carboxylesterase